MVESWEGTKHNRKIDNNQDITNNEKLKITISRLRSSILISMKKKDHNNSIFTFLCTYRKAKNIKVKQNVDHLCPSFFLFFSFLDSFFFLLSKPWSYLANIYLFKIRNRNIRKRSKICSKLTIKTPEWRHDVFLLLTLNIFHTFFSISILDFEQVNVSWVVCFFHINPLSVTKIAKRTRIHTCGYS